MKEVKVVEVFVSPDPLITFENWFFLQTLYKMTEHKMKKKKQTNYSSNYRSVYTKIVPLLSHTSKYIITIYSPIFNHAVRLVFTILAFNLCGSSSVPDVS